MSGSDFTLKRRCTMLQFTRFSEAKLVTETAKPTKDWYAWNDLEPPPPFSFHITGSIQVPNPGVLAFLHKRIPQGINSSIILLQLELIQLPGFWPAVMTDRDVRYDEVFSSQNQKYATAEIFVGNTVIHKVPVVDAH
jgi:hypothetical protein